MSIEFKNKLIDDFNVFRTKLNGQKISKIHNIRENAFELFSKMNVPTPKQEDWRFTKLNFLNEELYTFNDEKTDTNLTLEDIEKFRIKDLNENLIVFVNGVYSEKFSNIRIQHEEIILESFASADKRNAPNLIKNFSKYCDYKDDFFTAINTAFAKDGVYINIPYGVVIDEPLHIMYVNDTREKPVFSNPRNMIIVGQCSQIKIVETYHTIGDKPAFTNMVTEFVVGFSSMVEFYKIQNDKGNSHYIGTSNIHQEQRSSFNTTTVTLNGQFVRNNLRAKLADENSELNLYGFYYLKDNNFTDNRTLVDHAVPNCISNEFYKGILDDQSKAVFNGKVIVRPDAQKTNAYQTNKNILLTDDAKVYTQPQLEIYADDVKCSHGATTGYFDKEAMFYLRARGVSEEMAKSLMLNAYAAEVIEKIKVAGLRDEIKRAVAGRLTVDDIYFCDVLGDIFDEAEKNA